MMTDKIVLLSSTELERLVRSAVREELVAAGNQRKEERLLNAQQLCEYLGIHRSTLNLWKAQNKIPYRRLGKRIFFNQQEILDALEDSNYSKLKKLR